MESKNNSTSLFYGNIQLQKNHPLYEILQTTDNIIYKNAKMDGRVSSKYGKKIVEIAQVSSITTIDDLQNSFENDKDLSAFSENNRENATRCKAPKNLLRIDSIEGFAQGVIYQATQLQHIAIFTDILQKHKITDLKRHPKVLAKELYESLLNSNIESIKDLYAALAQSNPRYPWWCTALEDIEGIQTNEWTNALGLGHYANYLNSDNGTIKALQFTYEVDSSIIGNLFRPTMLQAVSSKYHAPSSPCHTHGYSLNLGNTQTPLLREFIHRPITQLSNVDIKLITLQKPNDYEDETLSTLRKRHYHQLIPNQCVETQEWLKQCQEEWV